MQGCQLNQIEFTDKYVKSPNFLRTKAVFTDIFYVHFKTMILDFWLNFSSVKSEIPYLQTGQVGSIFYFWHFIIKI